MNKNFKVFGIGLASLIIGLLIGGILNQCHGTEKVIESSYTPEEQPNISPPSPSNENSLSYDQLYEKAASITVKVLSGQTSGSGIIIQKQGDTYTVVTNNHVLIFGNSTQSYRLKTLDNQIYDAQVVNSIKFNDNDLGLLQFRSTKNYPIASLSRLSKVISEEEVYAAGFPAEVNLANQKEFVLNTGTMKMFSDIPFGGGYQIGYTNKVQKGMSGGPLFNRRGEIIGINGVHRYPLWGNPYVFQDGSVATPERKQRMSKYSWAIPIQTLLNLAPQFEGNKN